MSGGRRRAHFKRSVALYRVRAKSQTVNGRVTPTNGAKTTLHMREQAEIRAAYDLVTAPRSPVTTAAKLYAYFHFYSHSSNSQKQSNRHMHKFIIAHVQL